MKFTRRANESTLALNITALTDVVLLLILFFMFSTHFVKAQQRPMNLPKEPGESATPEGPKPLVIEIDKNGVMAVVGSQPMNVEEIIAAVRGAAGPDGKGRVDLVVRADRECPAAFLNKLAGALARAGQREWKLATDGYGSPAGG